ncbi:hypothetical protein JHW43_002786 [Diplocarpon mali]|nr:hypothetical protein JHW43_002786 [Diplocarpon mali]
MATLFFDFIMAVAKRPSLLQSLLTPSDDDELPSPFFSFPSSPFPPLYEGMSLPGGFVLPTYDSSSGLPVPGIRCTSVEDKVPALSGNYYHGVSQVVDDLNRRLYLTPNSHSAQDPLVRQFLINEAKRLGYQIKSLDLNNWPPTTDPLNLKFLHQNSDTFTSLLVDEKLFSAWGANHMQTMASSTTEDVAVVCYQVGFHTGIFARAERLGLQNVELCPYLLNGDADDFRKFASEVEYIKTLAVVELQHQLTPSNKSGTLEFDALASAFFAGEEIPNDLSELPSPPVGSYLNFIKEYGIGDWASVLKSDPLQDKSLVGFLRDVMASNHLEDWVEEGALPLFPQLALKRHVIYDNVVTFLNQKEQIIPEVKTPQPAAEIIKRQDERRSKWYAKFQGDNLEKYLVSVALQMSHHKKTKAAAIIDDPDATDSERKLGEASGSNSLPKDTTFEVLGPSTTGLQLTSMGAAIPDFLPPPPAVGKKAKKNKKGKEKKKAKKLAEITTASSSKTVSAGAANTSSGDKISYQKLVDGKANPPAACIATEEITTVTCDTLAADSPTEIVAVKSDDRTVHTLTEATATVKSKRIENHTAMFPSPLPVLSVELPLNSTTVDPALVETAPSLEVFGSSASAEPWMTVSYKAAQKSEKGSSSSKAIMQGNSSSLQTRFTTTPRYSDRRKGQGAFKPKASPNKNASQFASVRNNDATSIARSRPGRLNDLEEFPAMPSSSSSMPSSSCSKTQPKSLVAEPKPAVVRLVSKAADPVQQVIPALPEAPSYGPQSHLNDYRRGEDESTASDSSSSHESDITVVPSKKPETQARSVVASNPSSSHSEARDSHTTRSSTDTQLSAIIPSLSLIGLSSHAETEASEVTVEESFPGPQTIKELKDFDNLSWADLESLTKLRSRGTRSVMGDLNSEKRLGSTSGPPSTGGDDPFASDEERPGSRDINRLNSTASPAFTQSIRKPEQTYDGELRVNEQGRNVIFYRKDAEALAQSSPTPRHKRSVSGSGSGAQNSSYDAFSGQSSLDPADTQQVDSGHGMSGYLPAPVYPIQQIEGYIEQFGTRIFGVQPASYHPSVQASSSFSDLHTGLVYQPIQQYQHSEGPHFGMTPLSSGYQRSYGTAPGSGGDIAHHGDATLSRIPGQSTSNQFLDRDPTFLCQFCRQNHFPTASQPCYLCPLCGITPQHGSVARQYCSAACLLADAYDHASSCNNTPAWTTNSNTEALGPEFMWEGFPIRSLMPWPESGEKFRQRMFSMFAKYGRIPDIHAAHIKKNPGISWGVLLPAHDHTRSGDYHIFQSNPSINFQCHTRANIICTLTFPVENGAKMAVTRAMNVLLLADHFEVKRFLFRFLRFHLLDASFFATCNATQPQHVVVAEFLDQFTKEFGTLPPSSPALNVTRSVRSVRQALDLMDNQCVLLNYWSQRVNEPPRFFA